MTYEKCDSYQGLSNMLHCHDKGHWILKIQLKRDVENFLLGFVFANNFTKNHKIVFLKPKKKILINW